MNIRAIIIPLISLTLFAPASQASFLDKVPKLPGSRSKEAAPQKAPNLAPAQTGPAQASGAADAAPAKSVEEISAEMSVALGGKKEMQDAQKEIVGQLGQGVSEIHRAALTQQVVFKTLDHGLRTLKERTELQKAFDEQLTSLRRAQERTEQAHDAAWDFENSETIVVNNVAESTSSQAALEALLEEQSTQRTERFAEDLEGTYWLLENNMGSLTSVESGLQNAQEIDKACTEKVGSLLQDAKNKQVTLQALSLALQVTYVAKIKDFTEKKAEARASGKVWDIAKLEGLERAFIGLYQKTEKDLEKSKAEFAAMEAFAVKATPFVEKIRDGAGEIVKMSNHTFTLLDQIKGEAVAEIKVRAKTDEKWANFLKTIETPKLASNS